MDEPLGALDLKLRKEMQKELKRIQQEVGITFIFVTHDQEEALTMSDKIVVMKEGEIQQVGTPTDIYNEPINEYVANFIGESNIIEGVMLKDYQLCLKIRNLTVSILDLNLMKKSMWSYDLRIWISCQKSKANCTVLSNQYCLRGAL